MSRIHDKHCDSGATSPGAPVEVPWLLFMLYEVVFHAARQALHGGKALISPPWLGPALSDNSLIYEYQEYYINIIR